LSLKETIIENNTFDDFINGNAGNGDGHN
jgi:hypothetical protein